MDIGHRRLHEGQSAPFTPVADAYVVHLVRHPLATIRSRASWGTFADIPSDTRRYRLGQWAQRVVPEIADGRSPLEKAAIHWVKWNRLVVDPAEVLRLEDITAADVTRLARIVTSDAEAVELPPRTNGAPELMEELCWDDVAHVSGLRDLAAELGYR